MDLAAAALLGLGAYVLGSFPTGYVLVRAVRGTDIRDVGGGNVGALNTYQQVGAWGGLLVLSVDAAKGALAALAPGWSGAPEWTVFLTTPLVVAGHNWPLFIGFRGGKGAASILGVSLVVAPALTLITAGPAVPGYASSPQRRLGGGFRLRHAQRAVAGYRAGARYYRAVPRAHLPGNGNLLAEYQGADKFRHKGPPVAKIADHAGLRSRPTRRPLVRWRATGGDGPTAGRRMGYNVGQSRSAHTKGGRLPNADHT